MLDQICSANFRPLLHENFDLFAYSPSQPCDPTVHGDSRTLTLIEVTDLGDATRIDQTRRHPFSVIFRETAQTYLPQHIYTISHPALGRLDLFLVPIGPDRVGMQYQAVFN